MEAEQSSPQYLTILAPTNEGVYEEVELEERTEEGNEEAIYAGTVPSGLANTQARCLSEKKKRARALIAIMQFSKLRRICCPDEKYVQLLVTVKFFLW